MKCIDFDKAFGRYIAQWTKEHASEYKTYDELEEHVPEAYAEFLSTPADFLAGVKPGEYFEQFDNAKALVNWMEDYEKQRVPVPDMLLNRITDLGAQSISPLMNLLGKERTPESAKMCAITLLREVDAIEPAQQYVAWVRDADAPNELCDNALESLAALGDRVKDMLFEALDSATDNGKLDILNLLADISNEEILVDAALSLLTRSEGAVALLADIFARLGNDKALPALMALAASEDTEYLNYIELRSAIEALGGEAPERVFDVDDPDYLAMCAIEEKLLHTPDMSDVEGHDHDDEDPHECGCGHVHDAHGRHLH